MTTSETSCDLMEEPRTSGPEIDAPEADVPATATGGSAPFDEPCADLPLTARIEALLIGCDRPMTEARLAALLGLAGRGTAARVRETIDELNRSYEDAGRAFSVEAVAAGWAIYTRGEYAAVMAGLQHDRQHGRLSPAALETLAIIAYRTKDGGIIRAEIEAIRGVSCGEVLRGLLERRLVKIVGRKEELGRPMLYGVTRQFLEVFGLADLDDLPVIEGMPDAAVRRTPPEAAEAAEPAPETADAAETPPETADAADITPEAAASEDDAGDEDKAGEG
jgi:segregation and condensation protein B